MKKIIIVSLALSIALSTFAQEENAKFLTNKNKDFTMIWGGLETSTMPYINNNTKDSSATAIYLAPYIDYYHKTGFGLKVKTYIFPGGSDPGFFLTSFSPYFAKYTGKILPYVSYTRYWQHNNPSALYSPIENDIYAHLKFKTKVIDFTTGADWGFGIDKENSNKNVNDINAFFALSHVFYGENANDKSAWAFVPSLQLNAATNRYFNYSPTSNYISRNRTVTGLKYGNRGGRGGNGGNTTITEQALITETNQFELSNIEANIYAMYIIGNFSIEPSGSLFFPLHGDNTLVGYWQINLNYYFK
jgi:hypothetical protein